MGEKKIGIWLKKENMNEKYSWIIKENKLIKRANIKVRNKRNSVEKD